MTQKEKKQKIESYKYVVSANKETMIMSKIGTLMFSFLFILLFVLGYIFVLKNGNFFDYILSLFILSTFAILSVKEFKKYLLFKNKYEESFLYLSRLKETEEEKIKRERKSKYKKIMKEIS